jgi:hypothetical protein
MKIQYLITVPHLSSPKRLAKVFTSILTFLLSANLWVAHAENNKTLNNFSQAWSEQSNKSGQDFIHLLEQHAKNLGEEDVKTLMKEALTTSTGIALPVPQGINSTQNGAKILSWAINDPYGNTETSVAIGDTLGTLQLPDGTEIPIEATVDGKIIKPLKQIGDNLRPGESMAEILTSGNARLIAIALAIAKVNPSQILTIESFATVLSPNIASSITAALTSSFPSEIAGFNSVANSNLAPSIPTGFGGGGGSGGGNIYSQ